MLLGQFIRCQRRQKRWSRMELAQRAAMLPSVVARLEEGRRQLSTAEAVRLAVALGVDPGVFMVLE